MHRFIFRWRFLALAAPIAIMAALVFLGGGGARSLAVGPGTPTPPTGAHPNLTGVSCADVYVDILNDGIPDDINGDASITDADITSMTMARNENNQANPTTAYDVTTVSYLGYAGPGGLVPGGPPGPSCHSTTLGAAGSAEANKFGGPFQVAYGNQYGVRPTAIGMYDSGTQMLSFSSCGYSEAQSAWVRIDSFTHITKMGGAGTENDGNGVLYLGTAGPSSGAIDTNGDGVFDATTDGTTCDTTGSFAYHFVTKNYTRDARTDFLGNSKSTSASITADADGPANGKGNQTADSADGKADDWDGDGCTDWDELGKGYKPSIPLTFPPSYTWDTTNNAVSGIDPFNPADCDLNFTSTISMTTTILHNTGGAGSGSNATGCNFVQIIGNTCPPGNGQSFRCLGSFSQTKSGSSQPLGFRLGCYSDSTVTTVNSTLAGSAEEPSQCNNGLDEDSDTFINDGCATTGVSPESGANCMNNTDDDADGKVNDGCPAMAAPESGANCANNTDDDSDGKVNDGCPTISSEFGANCANATDDDGDSVVNDGCPAAGALHNTCPPASDEFCGDGKAGQPPAGCLPNPGSPTWCSDANAGPDGCTTGVTCRCPSLPCHAERFVYTGIDPATYPVVATGDTTHNYVDTVANRVHLGGCFAGFGGGAFGNVYGSSTVDLHTGAGSFQIYLNQTVANCNAGTPSGGAINGQIEIVELRTEKGLTAAQMYDSDRDGCADSQELLASQGAGGERDPYNPNDMFNPERLNTPNAQTVADILKVVGKYGQNQGNPLYTAATDRTAVPGGQVWNLGAPDGQQTVADILAAVKQYNHNCAFSTP